VVTALQAGSGETYSGPHLVFSDVDDTLYASGGKYVSKGAGVDDQFYHKEVYPGVAQFMLELARGPCEVEDPPSVILLSARPHSLKTLLEITDDHKVAKLFRHTARMNNVENWGVDVSNAQYGAFANFFLSCRSGMGLKKYEQWRDFRPEGDGKKVLEKHEGVQSVFVGDNGQCDAMAAVQMSRNELDTGESTKGMFKLGAAFIHDVQPGSGGEPAYDAEDERLALARHRVYLVKDYAEAAIKAAELGLISQAGMRRVLHAVADSNLGRLCQARHQISAPICAGEHCYPRLETACPVQTSGKWEVTMPPLEPLDHDFSVAMTGDENSGGRQINLKGRCDSMARSYHVRTIVFGFNDWHRVDKWDLRHDIGELAVPHPLCIQTKLAKTCGRCSPGYITIDSIGVHRDDTATTWNESLECLPNACGGHALERIDRTVAGCSRFNRLPVEFAGSAGVPAPPGSSPATLAPPVTTTQGSSWVITTTARLGPIGTTGRVEYAEPEEGGLWKATAFGSMTLVTICALVWCYWGWEDDVVNIEGDVELTQVAAPKTTGRPERSVPLIVADASAAAPSAPARPREPAGPGAAAAASVAPRPSGPRGSAAPGLAGQIREPVEPRDSVEPGEIAAAFRADAPIVFALAPEEVAAPIANQRVLLPSDSGALDLRGDDEEEDDGFVTIDASGNGELDLQTEPDSSALPSRAAPARQSTLTFDLGGPADEEDAVLDLRD